MNINDYSNSINEHNKIITEYNKTILKLWYITNGIMAWLMVIGITIAAIHFDKASLLWFYLIPFLSTDVRVSHKNYKNN